MITPLDHDFSQLNSFLDTHLPSKLFILVDENTHEHCLPILMGNLASQIPFEIIEIEAGEKLKTVETATQLWEILAEFQAGRDAIIINLGGGVITDLGGFVASTYKRGVRFVHIPTSLLAMCDASIGGKTGVDLHYVKNMVGSFALPEAVFLFPDFLKTLSKEELKSGFAEMLKHGLVADKKHWEELISINEINVENTSPFIEKSMKIKQQIVEKDYKEKNLRKILNFGHTIGHAIESCFIKIGTPIPHGEAVAIGMICETHLSFLEDLLDEKTSEHIVETILRFFGKIDISDFPNNELWELMKNDKKNTENAINFSLIDGLGSAVYDFRTSEKQVFASLNFYKNL